MCRKRHFHQPYILCRAGAVSTPLAAPRAPPSALFKATDSHPPCTPVSSSLAGLHPLNISHIFPPGSMLVAHTVKNLPAVQETKIGSLGWEDPGKRGMATHSSILGLPWWLSGKQSAWQYRRHGFDPWVGKIPWRWAWQPTPLFLPGEYPQLEEPSRLQSMGTKGRIRLSD